MIKENCFMNLNKNIQIKNVVRENYKNIALGKIDKNNCCNNKISLKKSSVEISNKIGYSEEEINSVPHGVNMGLGCGNPLSIASLKLNETLLDLGSGGGFDCFLASKQVGSKGFVIGVDMTHEMLRKARTAASINGYKNIDFRLGEVENLPVADNTVNVVISNCVINLSPNKQRVYDEIYRVLKPGGRIAISDIVLMRELTEDMKADESLYCG
jgi:arsenite methyltransferase